MDLSTSPIAWLLLRDGHSVPINGLSPEELNASRRALIPRPEVDELGHQNGLTAVVKCLGFNGDWGDYKRTHWPKLQSLMTEHGLRDRRDLFSVAANDLGFGAFAMRRALADRLFSEDRPMPLPRRVFTGHGHDWESWNALFETQDLSRMLRADEGFEPSDVLSAKAWVYPQRDVFGVARNLLGDQLLDLGRPGTTVLAEYRTPTTSDREWHQSRRRTLKVIDVFRWVIDQSGDGWLEIILASDGLAFLKGPDGAYDLVWRNLRTEKPLAHRPGSDVAERLHVLDRPGSLLRKADFASWDYYRQGSWRERDMHLAEEHHYQRGGLGGIAFPGLGAVLEQYLRDTGAYGEKPRYPAARRTPDGFRRLEGPTGGTRLVSNLITIGEFRAMMAETGYPDRRLGDLWEPGNDQDGADLPAAVTWYDAQAYCAWMERRLGVAVRLPHVQEYRSWRPAPDSTARAPVPASRCVEWLEPWSGQSGVPARCRFVTPLEWTRGPSDLQFVQAEDFFEWTQTGASLSGSLETMFGLESWGAYKHAKVGFRLVVEFETT